MTTFVAEPEEQNTKEVDLLGSNEEKTGLNSDIQRTQIKLLKTFIKSCIPVSPLITKPSNPCHSRTKLCLPGNPLKMPSNNSHHQTKPSLPGRPLNFRSICCHRKTKLCLPERPLNIHSTSSQDQNKRCLPGNSTKLHSNTSCQNKNSSFPGSPLKNPSVSSLHHSKTSLSGRQLKFPSIASFHQTKPCLPGSPLKNSSLAYNKNCHSGSPLTNPSDASKYKKKACYTRRPLHITSIASQHLTKTCIPGSPLRNPSIASQQPSNPSIPGNPLNIPSLASQHSTKPCIPGSPLSNPSIASQHPSKPCVPGSPLNIPSLASQHSTKPYIPGSPLNNPSIASQQPPKPCIPGSPLSNPSLASQHPTKPCIPGRQLKIPFLVSHQIKPCLSENLLKVSPAASLRKYCHPMSPLRVDITASSHQIKPCFSGKLLNISSIASPSQKQLCNPLSAFSVPTYNHVKFINSGSQLKINPQTKYSPPECPLKLTLIPSYIQTKAQIGKGVLINSVHHSSNESTISSSLLTMAPTNPCYRNKSRNGNSSMPSNSQIKENLPGRPLRFTSTQMKSGQTNPGQIFPSFSDSHVKNTTSRSYKKIFEEFLYVKPKSSNSKDPDITTDRSKFGNKHCFKNILKEKSNTLMELEKLLGLVKPTELPQPSQSNEELKTNKLKSKSGVRQGRKNRTRLSEQNQHLGAQWVKIGMTLNKTRTLNKNLEESDGIGLQDFRMRKENVTRRVTSTESVFKDCAPEFMDCESLWLDDYEISDCSGPLPHTKFFSTNNWVLQYVYAKFLSLIKIFIFRSNLSTNESYSDLREEVNHTQYCSLSVQPQLHNEVTLSGDKASPKMTVRDGEPSKNCSFFNLIDSWLAKTGVNNPSSQKYMKSSALHSHFKMIQMIYSVTIVIFGFGLIWSSVW